MTPVLAVAVKNIRNVAESQFKGVKMSEFDYREAMEKIKERIKQVGDYL